MSFSYYEYRVIMLSYINQDYIEKYLAGLITYPETPLMIDMRNMAKNEGFPILRPEVAAFLNVLVQIKKPASVLEIGTSIGYSGSVILRAMDSQGRLITIDSDEKVLESARNNFLKQGFEDRVILIPGDAKVILKNLDVFFDLIFVDGPKAQYLSYLPHCIRLLKSGGILICDNVLFKGMVANDNLVCRRKITIVKRMREFLSKLIDCPVLDTTIVPIGDGVSVSIKKEAD